MSQEQQKNNRVLIIVAIIGVIGTIVGAIINVIGNQNLEEMRQEMELTRMALVSIVTQGGATQNSMANTLSAPTATALAPVIVTATQQPTERPTITPTFPSFSDDFENGIKPDWNIMFGNIGMANGAFTVITPFDGTSSYHQAILDGYTWQNMKIKVNLLPFSHDSVYACDFPCGLEAATGIIIRYQPNGQSIGFFILAHSRIMALGTMNGNSEWSLITGTLVKDESISTAFNKRQLIIDAVGNTYTVYIDSKKVTSASIPGVTEEQVGLWFYNSNSDQSPNSYAARYDSFEIQGLP